MNKSQPPGASSSAAQGLGANAVFTRQTVQSVKVGAHSTPAGSTAAPSAQTQRIVLYL